MKTKLFIDTNVMLDLLGERVPFYNSVAKIATLAGELPIHAKSDEWASGFTDLCF